MVTLVPPAAGPLVGLMPVTAGRCMVTSSAPRPLLVGAVAVVPNETLVALVKLEPVMVTLVPPAAGPLFELMPVIAGPCIVTVAAPLPLLVCLVVVSVTVMVMVKLPALL